MIELVQSPDLNRVIADGNDTIIILQADANPAKFVRANIYIDGIEFLKQGWSKDENGICEFNLKHLYYAYFQNAFTGSFSTGFNKKEDLLKRVEIVAEEYRIGAIVPVNTLELPEFYLLKNIKPVAFDDEKPIDFLGLPQQNIKVDRNQGFVFPLYLRSADLLTVQVLNELNQEIYSETLEYYPRQLTQYDLDFKDLELAGLGFITVKFTTSEAAIQRKLIFEDASVYPAKTIFYENNFGFFISACLFGQKEELHSLSPASYTQQDGTEVTYDVEDNRELQLNSGYGYNSIINLIHAVATSLDVRMRLDSQWERVKSETKKVTRLVDNQYIYGDVLKFSRINVPSFTNANTYAMVPEVVNITVMGDENQNIEIVKAAFLTIYTAIQPASILQIREVPENGKLSYVDATGIVALSDMVTNNPEILPYNISLADFEKLIYEPNQRQAGLPLDTINFKMGTQVILSNTGSIKFNVIDIPETDLPPEITVNSIKYISLDSSNNGSAQIDANIHVSQGQSLEVIWEALNTAPVSFDDASLEDPTITLTNATPDSSYQIRVTANNLTNGLSSNKIITVNTSSFVVKVEKVNYPEGTNSEQVDFHIYDGIPGGVVTIQFSVFMFIIPFPGSRYVLYNYGLPEEEIKNSGTEELELELDENGEVTIPCHIQNRQISPVTIEIELLTVVAPQVIDPIQNKVTEEFSA